MIRKIVLVRHGRSAHVHTGWIDFDGFLRWRESYESAGIDADDSPPHELREIASAAGAIVASNAPRAIESARRLAPDAEITVSPLVRELTLIPPKLRGVRLPLFGWALTFGLQVLTRRHGHVTAEELVRAREAAQWLEQLTDERGVVVAVTHGSFRSVLAKALRDQGWRADSGRRRSTHWSAWPFTQ